MPCQTSSRHKFQLGLFDIKRVHTETPAHFSLILSFRLNGELERRDSDLALRRSGKLMPPWLVSFDVLAVRGN